MTDDDDILAAEFAIGLLDPAEAVAVQDRARTDATLSLRIAWWRDQLSPLADRGVAEPPAHLWRAIERRLAANDNAPRLVSRWRNAAIAAMSVAAALVVYVGVRPVPDPIIVTRQAPPPLVAMLTGERGIQVALTVDLGGRAIRTTPIKLDAGAGNAELWVIPHDGKPRSLGTFDDHAKSKHNMDAPMALFMGPDSTFAVSLEPKGGSPTGSPTGPVVATGKLIRA